MYRSALGTYEDKNHSSGERCLGFKEGSLSAGKWFGVELFFSIEGLINVMSRNFAEHRFSGGLSWPLRRIHINSFYRAVT